MNVFIAFSLFLFALDLECDRIRLEDADPDWEVALGVLLLQDHNVLAAGHVHADAVYAYLEKIVRGQASFRRF